MLQRLKKPHSFQTQECLGYPVGSLFWLWVPHSGRVCPGGDFMADAVNSRLSKRKTPTPATDAGMGHQAYAYDEQGLVYVETSPSQINVHGSHSFQPKE